MAKQQVPAEGSQSNDEKPSNAPPKQEVSESKPKPQQPILEFFSSGVDQYSDEQIQDVINRQIAYRLNKCNITDQYNVLFLFNTRQIIRSDANRIYRAVTKIDSKRPILLIISSPGGDIPAAYFIAKLCREYTKANFVVAVPRQAKSAATLICCGADQIHMGSLSELGPIDPQFSGIPALALKHSVEHLAQLTKDYPDAAEMFSSYLAKSLRIEALGYYERVAKSATQYAVRLLNSRRIENTGGMTSVQIANQLVYEYTDHSFVIDSQEALDIFGGSVVACNTSEYQTADKLYQNLDFIDWFCSYTYKKDFSYVGSKEEGYNLSPKSSGG
ncbi:MAG: ATP-dependent Clp protease proteolytic subunit [Sedimentisphaerales bacterium]|nr:ATP-dependent Clp protease proteolytic subunit [Sedimentisphaerales bacterium]